MQQCGCQSNFFLCFFCFPSVDRWFIVVLAVATSPLGCGHLLKAKCHSCRGLKLAQQLTVRRVAGTPLISSTEATIARVCRRESVLVEMTEAANLHAGPGSGPRGMGWVAAKHRDSGAELGASEGDHMLPVQMRNIQSRTNEEDLQHLPNVTGHKLTLVRRGVHQDPLNQIVAILISRDCMFYQHKSDEKTQVSSTHCQSMASGVDQHDRCRHVRDSGLRTRRHQSSDTFRQSLTQTDPCCSPQHGGGHAPLHGSCRGERHAHICAGCTSCRIGHEQVNQSSPGPLRWPVAFLDISIFVCLDVKVVEQNRLKNGKKGKIWGGDDLRHEYLCLRRSAEKHALTFSSSMQFSKIFCTTRLPVSPKATSCHIPASASFTLAMI